MRRVKRILALGAVLLVLSCGDDDASTSSTVTPRFTQGASSGVSAIRSAAGDVGHNTAAGITSLQYFVTKVQLCETLTVSGTSYSDAGNCATVYTAGNEDNAYDTFKVADADADTSSGWIDVVSTASKTATSITAGTYNYVIIETRKPVKLNANIVVPNGSVTLKTCTGGTVTDSGSSGDLLQTTTVSDMTSCTQAQVTLGSQGGGSWFKFSSAIVLTAGSSYTLDLAVNKTDLVAGGVESIGGWGTEATYKDGTYVMILPPIAIVPVVRTTSQTTYREQYELTDMSGLEGKIVLDLYFAGTSSDVGTGTIVGAGSRFVHNSSATTFTKMYNPYSVTVNSDGTYTIKDWQDNAIVDGLTRTTSSTAGSVGTATVNKEVLYSGDTGTGNVTANVSFIALTEM